MWDCKRGCGNGNAYQLVEKLTDLKSKAIIELLDTCGIGTTPDRPAQSQQRTGKPRIRANELRAMTDDEFQEFCKIKDLDTDAFKKVMGMPWRHVTEPHALLMVHNPSQPKAKACGVMQVHLEGKLIKTKHGEEKYPMIFGSVHGLFGVHWIMNARPKVEEIIFAEGWRDCIAAVAAGYYATASSGGASCFKDEWLPLFKGKKVHIIMDADKPGVKAADRAAYKIVDVAKEVRIVKLPYPITEDHGKDLCDWLSEPKTQTLKKLIDDTPLYDPPIEVKEPDIVILKSEDVDEIARAYEDDCPVKHKYNSRDGLSIYSKNQYQRVDDLQEPKLWIRHFLRKCRVKKKKVLILAKRKTSGAITDIFHAMCSLPEVHLLPSQQAPCSLDGSLDPKYIIALNNGLLDWSVYPYKLHPLTPKFYTLNYLPFDWLGEKDSEMWIKYLIDVTDSDVGMFELLQMWAGYCLMKHDQTQQKFMLCYGESGTGKSVFCDVLSSLLGKNNVSMVSLKNFGDPRYVIEAFGKLLNIAEETEGHVEENIEASLKHYTGSTMFQFRRLYGAPFSAYPTAKVMIVTNHRPKFKDTSNAIWRRLLTVPFDCIIPDEKMIKGLSEKIIETEMPGVLKWALEGARKLNKADKFIIPEKCKIALEEHRRESQPEIGFLEENFEECDPESQRDLTVKCQDFRRAYEKWCNQNGVGKKSQKRLFKTIAKMFPHCQRQRCRKREQLSYYYIGLAMKTESEFYEEITG